MTGDILKKSILQLAVTGKLVSQNSKDEPASKLLERINKEREKLIKEGKLKKQKFEPIKEDELPFEIPKSWCWARLGEISIINPRNDVADDNMEAFFMPMNLLEAGFKNKHSYKLTYWKRIKTNFTHIKKGDIVVAKITPCFQNRKSAIIQNVSCIYGAGTTELHVIRQFSKNILQKYILWYLKNERFIIDGVNNFTGTVGQQRISSDFIKLYLIPLPPFAEQKRIVEKIEKLFVECNKLSKILS